LIAKMLADRAGYASKTTTLPAGINRHGDMVEAGFELIAFGGERIDGASGKTGPIAAIITRMPSHHLGFVQFMINQEGCAESEPEAVSRMDGQAERGGEQGACTFGPADEGMVRRAVEREDGIETEFRGDVADDLLCPPIKRQIGALLPGLVEDRPDHRANIADDGDPAWLSSAFGKEMLTLVEGKRSQPCQTLTLQS